MTHRLNLHIETRAAALEAAAGQGLDLALEHLLTQANLTVPHEDGDLEQSGTTSRDGLKGAVSYDTPYAVFQHEVLELVHDGKGRAKWLEVTMAEQSPALAQIIANSLRTAT